MHIFLFAEQLGLYENFLNGAIPTELGLLKKLDYLVLHGNRLTGTIPTSLVRLSLLSKSQSLLFQYKKHFLYVFSRVRARPPHYRGVVPLGQ